LIFPFFSHRWKRVAAVAAAAVVALNGLSVWSQRPQTAPEKAPDGQHRIAGAIHIHSRFSDGGGTIEEIVAAARQANLQYVILTDHNDALPFALAKQYEGYRDGVLVIVGEEVNTSAGHLLVLNMDRPVEQQGANGLPALLDTIAVSGGLSFIAHPDGRRPWTAWSVGPLHGIEVFNADTEWRNDGPLELLNALFWLSWMPQAAMNTLIDRPDSVMARWCALLKDGPVTGIGSVDAHARIPLFGDWAISFPSYAQMFGLIGTRIVLDGPLTGDADADRARLMEALHAGRCYIAVESFERADRFRFEWVCEEDTAGMGAQIVWKTGGRIETTVVSSSPTRLRLFRDGEPVKEIDGATLTFPISLPGLYHAEVYQLRRVFPFVNPTPKLWIVSNPIFIQTTPLQNRGD